MTIVVIASRAVYPHCKVNNELIFKYIPTSSRIIFKHHSPLVPSSKGGDPDKSKQRKKEKRKKEGKEGRGDPDKFETRGGVTRTSDPDKFEREGDPDK